VPLLECAHWTSSSSRMRSPIAPLCLRFPSHHSHPCAVQTLLRNNSLLHHFSNNAQSHISIPLNRTQAPNSSETQNPKSHHNSSRISQSSPSFNQPHHLTLIFHKERENRKENSIAKPRNLQCSNQTDMRL
jgi:hypothetical protein